MKTLEKIVDNLPVIIPVVGLLFGTAWIGFIVWAVYTVVMFLTKGC